MLLDFVQYSRPAHHPSPDVLEKLTMV